ncbi:MAG: deoxyribodipyrimidine photo-lyase, partial [Rhodobacteraceae bacterium]|nr:deoxyribodipyrimidine photo-lyase [Paracoccaceae bacterium]
MQVVWFKRDLRVHDHRALAQAAARGPVLPLYVIEPEFWQQSDMSARHWAFVGESL